MPTRAAKAIARQIRPPGQSITVCASSSNPGLPSLNTLAFQMVFFRHIATVSHRKSADRNLRAWFPIRREFVVELRLRTLFSLRSEYWLLAEHSPMTELRQTAAPLLLRQQNGRPNGKKPPDRSRRACIFPLRTGFHHRAGIEVPPPSCVTSSPWPCRRAVRRGWPGPEVTSSQSVRRCCT